MLEFQRTEMLFGEAAVEKLKNSHILLFGVGGVGGHLFEALVRSGVGEITVVDGDSVDRTNINRQIIALQSTVGMAKTDAAAARAREINPECRVNTVNEFVLPEWVDSFDLTKYSYVADAIDTVSAKLAIIKKCDELSVPVISAMGAGNKLDPTRFEVTDIYDTSVCPLAAAIRRECRRRGVKKLKVVYSKEEATVTTSGEQTDGATPPRRRTPASYAVVPAVCGLIMAGEIIRDLTGNFGGKNERGK